MAEQELLHHISTTQEQVSQLKEETANATISIMEEVKTNYVSRAELDVFSKNFTKDVQVYLSNRLDLHQEKLIKLITKMLKEKDNEDTTSTQYDPDHDVIMKSRFVAPVNQIPDPGLFDGNTAETELFCELCWSTFKNYPNSTLSEEIKIDFVKTRLRGTARNWYLTKYTGDNLPFTLESLLLDIRTAFPNVVSKKLARLQILQLKQQYGKINEYINEFRKISSCSNIEEPSLALLFYNGLHPRLQEEIRKSEKLPETLEEIITKCVFFENNMAAVNKISPKKNQIHGKINKQKSRSKNFKNNFNKNYSSRSNFNNNSDNKNNTTSNVVKANKINSKN